LKLLFYRDQLAKELPMSCQVIEKNGHLGLQGELTVDATTKLWPELLARVRTQRGESILDCSAVTAMDTAGMQIVLMLRRLSLAYGSTFLICEPSTPVRQILDACGLGDCIGSAGHGIGPEAQ